MLDVYANDVWVDRNWIPELPGLAAWIRTYIPPDNVTTSELRIRIVTNGFYMPLQHIVQQTTLYPVETIPEPLASFQDGAFYLADITQHISGSRLSLYPYWYNTGNAEGDYRFFAHLYDDVDQPPVAQGYHPSQTYIPPGNLIPGLNADHAIIEIGELPPGTYTLAIGFYDPYTGERLMPASEVYEVSPDGRLFLGQVEIPGEE
jgi:hypothetical protein